MPGRMMHPVRGPPDHTATGGTQRKPGSDAASVERDSPVEPQLRHCMVTWVFVSAAR